MQSQEMQSQEMKLIEKELKNFYQNKTIFVTGHTGFKGSWLCELLLHFGAFVIGFALPPEENSLFSLLGLSKRVKSIGGDIRGLESLSQAIINSNADVVFHLAAQSLVLESYKSPVFTYGVNVMGTVNLLESIRQNETIKSVVNITTDKVYRDVGKIDGYTEDDKMGGFDPYSNSKSCSEFVSNCYRNSFLNDKNIAISTMRAGNVIGGGDFAENRIIPDCVRSALNNEDIKVRHPHSVRPYQHVLDPLVAYLTVAMKQYENKDLQGAYNIGPHAKDCIATGKLVDLFCKKWGENLNWINLCENKALHETNLLYLNSEKIIQKTGFSPNWNVEKAVEKTIEWTKFYKDNANLVDCIKKQIEEYFS